MKIARIWAQAYAVPVEIPLARQKYQLPFVLATVETDDGLRGTGLCGGNELTRSIAGFINERVGAYLIGEDPLATERVWQRLYAKYNGRGLTGVWSSVVSALDIALWDLKGKHLGQPIAALLGGASEDAAAYVTFGVSEYSRDELIEAAQLLAKRGHNQLKMVVGGSRHIRVGAQKASPASPRISLATLREDAARVHAVREALGPEAELMIDGNCVFSVPEAQYLCSLVEDVGLTWFEEPVKGNDFRALQQVRQKTGIPIAAGQNLGHCWAHRELIINGAVDIAQPNVVHGGGYTECLKVAALARAFNMSIANGGAWPHHNLHLHAGVPNGGQVEFHMLAWLAGEEVFDNPPKPEHGRVRVPDAPGLGFEPKPQEELAKFAIKA